MNDGRWYCILLMTLICEIVAELLEWLLLKLLASRLGRPSRTAGRLSSKSIKGAELK